MSRIEILKKPLMGRPLVIALSIAVIVVVGFGLNLHLLAVPLSALLFACGYLLDTGKGEV